MHDALRVYDQRFLDLAPDERSRLVQGTRRVLGSGLDPGVRAALPAAYRLRAFCIQHGMDEELERLIRDELAGHREGAVVVGGRAYVMYPYLRGVPRQDADITAEVDVEHRLDAFGWHGGLLRVRGHASIARVESPRTAVTLLLRAGETEHRFPATADGPDFEVPVDPAGLTAGRWEAHVSARTLGLTREAPFGAVRGPRLGRGSRKGAAATARLAPDGPLVVEVHGARRIVPLLTRLRGRVR
ncbi:hypothetical protein DPM19_24800 [Actinomadura craniellae]|uniref:TarS/TarP linker domain-containing protein n=1 Tax=Actinomadura craniellae TaxID=2231787 RepID=A0A365H2U3_9ACTN|nr:hypothetical protein DPM19_24800 [Actinomadura craniellae]